MSLEIKTVHETPWKVAFARNPDGWFASVKLSLRVLLYAPSSLLWMVGDAVVGVATSAFMLVLNLLVWIAVLPAQVVAGLCGFLSDRPGKED